MPVDSIRTRRDLGPTHEPAPASRSSIERDVPASLGRALARVDVLVAANAAAAATSARPRSAVDDGIVYLGLNGESSAREIGALRQTGNVRVLGDRAAAKFDLSIREQRAAFVQSLGLDPRVSQAVADVLASSTSSPAVLAEVAAFFAEAERGMPIPSRLVISGHSGGLQIWGERHSITLVDLQRLARAMPRAAERIEDIHFSACSTAGQAGVDHDRAAWQASFPKLKTMWGYAGVAPLAPVRHLQVWARATRGPHDSIVMPEDVASQRVAIWSQKGGYQDRMSLPELRAAQAYADRRFAEVLARGSDDPQTALADYQTYRMLSQKNQLAPQERAAFAQKADQLLRIRYYDEGVRSEFQRRHGSTVRAGFAALGLRAPDFGSLSRRDALAAIASFEQSLEAAKPAPSTATAALAALRGLRDLDRRTIPETDCHH
jgi:hypothetical protein